MKDYYALLGVNKDATKAEMKKNYRKLAVAFHPDKNSDPNAAEKFIAVNEAYEVLSNKKSRVRYDLFRWEELKRQKEDSGTFTSAAPTFESPRSRRKKSQHKRSINYHQEKNGFFKTMKLIQESLIVISRYFIHIIGITVFSVIFGSTLNQLSNAFDVTFFRGVIVSGFSLLIVYIIFKLLFHIITEYKKDLLEFSVFYKISQKRIAVISFFTFCFVLIFYLSTVMKTIQRV